MLLQQWDMQRIPKAFGQCLSSDSAAKRLIEHPSYIMPTQFLRSSCSFTMTSMFVMHFYTAFSQEVSIPFGRAKILWLSVFDVSSVVEVSTLYMLLVSGES